MLSTSRYGLVSSPNHTLPYLMWNKADIVLKFDQALTDESQSTLLPAHASIVRMHSTVLAEALAVADGRTSSSSSHNSSGEHRTGLPVIPLPGTTKEEFLQVAQFMYPIIPVPSVTWDNLEVLLIQGHKWGMTYILHTAERSIIAGADDMDATEGGQQNAFKWLKLADAAGLEGACHACVRRIVELAPGLCSEDQKLEGLSVSTLRHLVTSLAARTDSGRCSNMCRQYGRNNNSATGYRGRGVGDVGGRGFVHPLWPLIGTYDIHDSTVEADL